MPEGDGDPKKMREFIVLWRLKEGPRTEAELLEDEGLKTGTEEAKILSSIVIDLHEQGLIVQKDEVRQFELTQAGKDLIAGATDVVPGGFMDMVARILEEDEHEG